MAGTNAPVLEQIEVGDGWLRISAKTVELYTQAEAIPDFYDPVVDANFKCEVRTIDRFVLHPDNGLAEASDVTQRVWLQKPAPADYPQYANDGNLGFFVGTVTLYESNRNDDQDLLEERLATLYGANGQIPTAGGARFPHAAELNPLTKLCTNATGDFNDNGLPDIDETGQQSDALFTRMSYFAELNRGFYVPPGPGDNHGSYHIWEKRRAANAEAGKRVALGYPDPTPVACPPVEAPDDFQYWRRCARRPDGAYDPQVAQTGMDLQEWAFYGNKQKRHPFYPGMGHPSQFKCLKVVAPGSDELDPSKPHIVTDEAFVDGDGRLRPHTCEYAVSNGTAPPYGSYDGAANPYDAGHSCVEQAPAVGDIVWAAVDFEPYATGTGYTRGCVDECAELASVGSTHEGMDEAKLGELAYDDVVWPPDAISIADASLQCLDTVPPDLHSCCTTDVRNHGHGTCPAATATDGDGDGEIDVCAGASIQLLGGRFTTAHPPDQSGIIQIKNARLGGKAQPACVGGVCLINSRLD